MWYPFRFQSPFTGGLPTGGGGGAYANSFEHALPQTKRILFYSFLCLFLSRKLGAEYWSERRVCEFWLFPILETLLSALAKPPHADSLVVVSPMGAGYDISRPYCEFARSISFSRFC